MRSGNLAFQKPYECLSWQNTIGGRGFSGSKVASNPTSSRPVGSANYPILRNTTTARLRVCRQTFKEQHLGLLFYLLMFYIPNMYIFHGTISFPKNDFQCYNDLIILKSYKVIMCDESFISS